MGLGRAGAPGTPTRCVEIPDARWAKRAEGAVQAACMRSLRADEAVVTFLVARPPRMTANPWTPSTEPSDPRRAGQRPHRLCLKAVQDDCSRRPRLADRHLEVAGPALGTAQLTVMCVGQSAFKCPVLGAQEEDCPVTGSQVAPLLEPADIGPVEDRGNPSDRHRHVRTGGPSVDANAAYPPPPVLGRANLGRARNGAYFIHSRDMNASLGLGTGPAADSN